MDDMTGWSPESGTLGTSPNRTHRLLHLETLAYYYPWCHLTRLLQDKGKPNLGQLSAVAHHCTHVRECNSVNDEQPAHHGGLVNPRAAGHGGNERGLNVSQLRSVTVTSPGAGRLAPRCLRLISNM